MLPTQIPYDYVSHHRIERTREDDFKHGYLVEFNTQAEARDFAKVSGGVVIHDQSGVWFVFPSDIEGSSEVVTFNTQD